MLLLTLSVSSDVDSVVWGYRYELEVYGPEDLAGRECVKNIVSIPATHLDNEVCIYNAVLLMHNGVLENGVFVVDAVVDLINQTCREIYVSLFDGRGGYVNNITVFGSVQVVNAL